MFHSFLSRTSKKSMGLIIAISLLLTLVVTPTIAYIVVRTSSMLNTFVSGLDPVGGLVIRKIVNHPFGDDYVIPEHIEFTFRVNLGKEYAGKELNTSQGTKTADDNGVFYLTLQAGYSVGIHEIISGTTVTVTEIQNDSNGFTVYEGITEKSVTISAREDNVITFLNIYEPKPVDPVNLEVAGIKNLEGRQWQEGDTFTFQLDYRIANSDDEWKELDTQSVLYEMVEVQDPEFPDNPEKTILIEKPDFNRFDFTELISSLQFSKPGIYAFRVSEIEGSIAGITYDNNVSYFDVVVGDADMDGKLEIQQVIGSSDTEVSLSEETGNHSVLFTFNNSYAPEGSTEAVIEIIKRLEDKSGQNKYPSGFVFELYDSNGELLMTSAPTTAAGEVSLKLIFAAEQAGQTFRYVLKEQNSGEIIDGIIYDDTEYRFFVSVIDNYDGTIRSVVYEDTISDDNGEIPSVTVPVADPTEPEIEATDPTTDPTEPESNPTEPTEGVTDPTEPSTDPTEPVAEPTDPEVVPTEPVTEPTEPVTVPTEPVTEPTEPVTVPTEPVTEPSEPVTVPTEPVTEPTEPESVPTEPAIESTEPVTVPTEPATEPTEAATVPIDGFAHAPVINDSMKFRAGENRLSIMSVTNEGELETDSSEEQNEDPASETIPNVTDEPPQDTETTTPIDSTEPTEDVGSDSPPADETVDTTEPPAGNNATGSGDSVIQQPSDTELEVNPYGEEIPVDATNIYVVTFENIYVPNAASIQLSGNKNLSGRKLKDQEFAFELYRTDSDFIVDDHSVLVHTVRNNADGSFCFDELSFRAVGTYYYVIKENRDEALGGVTYDTNKYLITVTVSDHNGVLKASHLITDSFGVQSPIVFKNEYTPSAIFVPLTAKKIFEGKDLTDGMFRFQLYRANENYAADGNPIDKVTNNDQGLIAFKDLEFTKSGVYYFIVREDTSYKLEHVTYDHSVYGIKVTVTDNNEGVLIPNMEIQLLGSEAVDEIVFVNTYVEPETTVPTEPDTQPSATTETTVPTTKPPRPDGPPTGDTTNIGFYVFIALISAFALIILWDMRRSGILKKR